MDHRNGGTARSPKRTPNIPMVGSPVADCPALSPRAYSPRQFVASSSPSSPSSPSSYANLEGKAREAAMKTALGGGGHVQSGPHEGEGRKRRTTTLVVMKKPGTQTTTFPVVVVKRRRAISEPFLASWDYSAQHTYLAVQPAGDTVEIDGLEPEPESDLRDDEEEEEVMPAQATTTRRGTQHMVSEMQDLVAGVKLDDPLQYYAKLERLPDEVQMGSVDGRAVVVSGTYRGLVTALLTDVGDETYLETFLATHRYFTDAVSLMKRLQLFYQGIQLESYALDADSFRTCRAKQAAIRQKIIKIVQTWVTLIYTDFLENASLMEELNTFENLVLEITGKSPSWRMLCIARAKAQHRVDERAFAQPVYVDAPKSLVPLHNLPSLLDFSPVEMARQLTLLEWAYFSAIPNHEFFNKAWSSSDGQRAPFIRNYIDRFNQTCYWVATEIVLTPNTKQRSVVIERFIDLASHCMKLANYNAVMAIHLALNLDAVSRLKASWKGVSAKHLQRLNEISPITDPSHNYANYRKLLASTRPPMIPFQALNLKELTFIEENVSRLEDPEWINFEKMSLLAKVLVTIAHLQKLSYRLNEVDVVMRYLKRPPIVLSEKELVLRSRQCEPSLDCGGSSIDRSRGPGDLKRASRISGRLTRGLHAVRSTFKNLKEDPAGVAQPNL